MILVNKQLYDMHFFQGEKKKLANPLIVAIPVATYMRGRLELCFLPTLIFPFALWRMCNAYSLFDPPPTIATEQAMSRKDSTEI